MHMPVSTDNSETFLDYDILCAVKLPQVRLCPLSYPETATVCKPVSVPCFIFGGYANLHLLRGNKTIKAGHCIITDSEALAFRSGAGQTVWRSWLKQEGVKALLPYCPLVHLMPQLQQGTLRSDDAHVLRIAQE